MLVNRVDLILFETRMTVVNIIIKGSCEQLVDERFLLPVSKRVFVQSLYHKNELMNLQAEVNGFALRLVLTQRQKATRKWPIG